ncbi:unnamed protein product, partial [Prunus brigantina]
CLKKRGRKKKKFAPKGLFIGTYYYSHNRTFTSGQTHIFESYPTAWICCATIKFYCNGCS